MIIGLDMKIDKSMEQLNSIFRERITMSIDDIAIHVYILSIWVQWYYRVCLHPVTAYIRVNMVTAWLPVVSLSNDQCQNVSICHCVCLPIVIRFLFLIYIIRHFFFFFLNLSVYCTQELLLSKLHFFFIFPRRCQNFTVYCEVPLRYLHFYCHCLLYTYLYCHNMTVYCMLSSILHCSFYTSMNKSILSTANKISLLKLHSLLPNSIVKTLMSNALHRRWDFTSWYLLPTSIQLLKPSLSVAFCHCQNLTVCRMLLSCHYISLSTATNTP